MFRRLFPLGFPCPHGLALVFHLNESDSSWKYQVGAIAEAFRRFQPSKTCCIGWRPNQRQKILGCLTDDGFLIHRELWYFKAPQHPFISAFG